ncbi:type II toxin-antitoxin system VapC family toxin [Saccharopolyspora erythraea]|uniref:type II toxin-antitoxin system VapC family toxin n=1 Tax=Saccharopolyspora erythraea TaxID=1836 RepID=UPI001BA61218|nr:type II toxin-antitoxin system VapC family toxin [Saccharopolyspora erythraea]QUH00869.1 type II toxin-antitoxin system VapC family toxin [Saccharopolyspora erythraea]
MSSSPIILDASALLDYLTGQETAPAIEAVLAGPAVSLHAPMLLDEEVLSVVRRLERGGYLDRRRAEEILQDATALNIELHPLRAHFDRVWSLRHAVHAADAYYVSLAETLDAPLLATDQRLVRGASAVTGIKFVPLPV